MRRTATFILVLSLVTGACGRRQDDTNVRPPQPGVPSGRTEITGIYRTIHQGLLQLRADGSFVMVISNEDFGSAEGTWSLADGQLQVRTSNCAVGPGSYRVKVTGEPLPGKAILHFEAESDPCGLRQKYLTIDPWVYAVS